MQTHETSLGKPKVKTVDAIKIKKECCSYLGELGYVLFITLIQLNREISTGELLDWAKEFQNAVYTELKPEQKQLVAGATALPNKRKALGKPLISNWRKLAPKIEAASAINGLEFRIANIKIRGGEQIPWQGNLICLYEVATNSFFHYFFRITQNSPFTANAVLYALVKSLWSVEKKAKLRSPTIEKKLIHLPDCKEDDPAKAVYEKVQEELMFAIRDRSASVKGLKRDQFNFPIFGLEIGRPVANVVPLIDTMTNLSQGFGIVLHLITKTSNRGYSQQYKEKSIKAPRKKPGFNWTNLKPSQSRRHSAPPIES